MESTKILHLSDIHFGYPDPEKKQHGVSVAIKSAIDTHVKKYGAPNLCIFSGDLTQSGAESELILFENWLETLFDDDLKQNILLLIVPGNHEVERHTPLSDEYFKALGLKRSAFETETKYSELRSKVLSQTSSFSNFITWHKKFKGKTQYKVLSDWEKSIAGCSASETINNLKIKVIGLNTALLSCDNSDQEKLVADSSTLNDSLIHINPSEELIIVVGHHPVGELMQEKWLVGWNNKSLQDILLASNGPHIYLHGHIHKPEGITLNMMAGQNISVLGAGACYQNTKYPMYFAFYDINMEDQVIEPFTYHYKNKRRVWTLDVNGESSESIRAVLPLPKKNSTHLRELLSSALDKNKALKEKIESKNTSILKIVNGLYSGGIRHHFSSIRITVEVDSSGTSKVTEHFEILALNEGPVHYWTSSIFSDPESSPIDDGSKLNVQMSCSTEKIEYSVIDINEERKKIIAFFLPEIPPGKTRSITRSYTWPNYLPHLIEGKEVVFSYNHLSGDNSAKCKFEFSLEMENCSKLITANQVRKDEDGELKEVSSLAKTTVGNKVSYVYKNKDVRLNEDAQIFRFNGITNH